MNYEQMIDSKFKIHSFAGLEGSATDAYAVPMFPHQVQLTAWALRKGRAAIFADTGLGKTRMELAWSARVAREGRVLILAPLAVAQQIQDEANAVGVAAVYRRTDAGAAQQIVIANYEMLHAFDPREFVGVVLDESSILKSFTGRTRTDLINAFAATPYRLAATATPAPNDFTELGNHAEFLGIKTRTEMLAEYFTHDGGSTQDWRIKGHAVGAFWKWVATWGAVVRTPADLGHDASAYELPPLTMQEHIIHAEPASAGLLFADDARTLSEQRAVRRATLGDRVSKAVEIAGAGGQCIVWCEMNDEADAVTKAIPDAVQVAGSDTPDAKAGRLLGFAHGQHRVLVSKPSICGFGLNFQRCSRMVFVGASHSYEQTYQAIRRCWRYGQTKAVEVHVVRADVERYVVENYRRKEADAQRMGAEMAAHAIESVRAEVTGASAREFNPYYPAVKQRIPEWIGQEVQP